MAAKPLPMIPRKYLKPNGVVELWDMEAVDGPVKIERTGILAREALQRDPDRYKLELPRGVKPGQAQFDAEERAREEQAEAEAEAPDPVFGQRNQS